MYIYVNRLLILEIFVKNNFFNFDVNRTFVENLENIVNTCPKTLPNRLK